jgi:hypothetical protein
MVWPKGYSRVSIGGPWTGGCRVVMVDSSAEAAEVMRARLGGDRVVYLDATGTELEQQLC